MLHLKKLAPGIANLAELAEREARHIRPARKLGGRKAMFYRTGIAPKRIDALLDGGSLYWVVKGYIRARQRLLFLGNERDKDGKVFCRILLDPDIVSVDPPPHRPFQGWRYLDPADAPGDRTAGGMGVDDLPDDLADELRSLGLI